LIVVVMARTSTLRDGAKEEARLFPSRSKGMRNFFKVAFFDCVRLQIMRSASA